MNLFYKMLHFSDSVSKVVFFRPVWLIWIFRILFTFNVILPGVNYGHLYYPLDVLVVAALAYWFDLGKMTIFALLLLFLATMINVDHCIHMYRD